MKTKETTIEYFIPPTKKQRGLLFGFCVAEIQKVLGIDREAADERMRTALIKWGYITESRSELDYWQTKDIIDRCVKFLAKRGICIE